MHRIILASGVALGLAVSWLGSLAPGQSPSSYDASSDEAIERGETLILDVARQRELLPSRWACTIDFTVDSTPDAASFMHIKGRSFVAKDKALDVHVRYTDKMDSQVGEEGLSDWETVQVDWSKSKEHLVYEDGSWVVARPVQIREHLDPFMLFMANSGSLRKGLPEDLFETVFFGFRSCLGSRETKKGVETVWGGNKRENNPSSAWFILHDPKIGMPVDFESRFYDLWDPADLKKKHKLIQKSTTTWIVDKSLNVTLPIEVQSNWMNNDESLEAVFKMTWLFDNDVPDTTFSDPRSERLIIPIGEKGIEPRKIESAK